jgi:putative ABC transport system substrate-binding protein
MMDRRAFLTMVSGSIVAAPFATGAQQTGKVYRIGFLFSGWPSDTGGVAEAFRDGLRDLGYIEGRNITIEYRFAEGRLDRYPDLASELVRLQVDVILAPSTAAGQAGRKATTKIPVVYVMAQLLYSGIGPNLSFFGGCVHVISLSPLLSF